MSITDNFVEALLDAPLGVSVLLALESRVRSPDAIGWVQQGTSPTSVDAAVELVEQLSLGEFLELSVLTGYLFVGPWSGGAAATVAGAYRHALDRRPIAEAITARFGTALHQPIDLERQQWWSTEGDWQAGMAPLFVDYERVYEPGQFTWAGLWTVSEPPVQVVNELLAAWEMSDFGQTCIVDLPVRSVARVFEINRPEDWARLVRAHPRQATNRLGGWELPGINQRRAELTELLAVPRQRATRTAIRRHLVPDWRSVASEFDGVHLSWAGWLTSDGSISDLGGGDVAMLRFWFSERAHWLRDVFGDIGPSTPALPRLLGR
mgnify:CR=1 FL=1